MYRVICFRRYSHSDRTRSRHLATPPPRHSGTSPHPVAPSRATARRRAERPRRTPTDTSPARPAPATGRTAPPRRRARYGPATAPRRGGRSGHHPPDVKPRGRGPRRHPATASCRVRVSIRTATRTGRSGTGPGSGRRARRVSGSPGAPEFEFE